MTLLTKRLNTPYARIGETAVAQGYSVIPILPGAKFPGTRSHGKWVAEHGWQRFCDRLPTEIETSTWATWPDAGACVVLGMGGVVAVDIDTDDHALTEAIVSILPDSPLVKRGRKGKTLFYRAPPAVVSKPFDIGRERILDLLAHGRQTVIPPTIHPDTGRAYEWIEGCIEDVSADELPWLPDDIAERFADALRPFGYEEDERSSVSVGEMGASGSIFRAVNEMALANFDAWVPHLNLLGCKRHFGGVYRCAAAWRGGDNPTSVAFHPTGIRDHKMGQGHTPIDIVMLAAGADFGRAFSWLADRLGYRPVEIDVAALVANAERKRSLRTETPAEPAVVTADTSDESITEERLAGLPEHLCTPPGAVGEFAKFVFSCARFPSAPLALASALGLTAALIGRRYKGPTGLRSNVYLVGVASSGFGKDTPLHAPRAIAGSTEAGRRLVDKFFVNDIASIQGLAQKLRKDPAVLFPRDEFGKWLGGLISRKAPAHREAIATALLELTGAARGEWGGFEKAEGTVQSCVNPCFSMLGVTTPETFWHALGGGNISDGLLGRLVILDAGNVVPEKVRRPKGDVESIPKRLTEIVKELVGEKIGGNLLGLAVEGDKPPAAVLTADWSDEAEDVYETFDAQCRAMKVSIGHQALITRPGENALRLALIVAVGVNPAEPLITADIMRWACEVARHSLEYLLRGADENVADNEKSAEYLRVRSIVKASGQRGVTSRDINRALRGSLDKRRLADVIEQLREAGDVVHGTIKSGSGQVMKRFWLDDYVPPEASPLAVLAA